MTLKELAKEYRQSEEKLTARIHNLRQARRAAGTEERYRLDRRITMLRTMRRDTAQTADRLEHYYDT